MESLAIDWGYTESQRGLQGVVGAATRLGSVSSYGLDFEKRLVQNVREGVGLDPLRSLPRYPPP
jgi:hypothetical protein